MWYNYKNGIQKVGLYRTVGIGYRNFFVNLLFSMFVEALHIITSTEQTLGSESFYT